MADLPGIAALFSWTATFIGVIGTSVILWGILRGLARLVRLEAASITGRAAHGDQEGLRAALGFHLLLGLEFLVAADIVETLANPTLKHMAILAAIVLIRTAISAALSWELSHGRAPHAARHASP